MGGDKVILILFGSRCYTDAIQACYIISRGRCERIERHSSFQRKRATILYPRAWSSDRQLPLSPMPAQDLYLFTLRVEHSTRMDLGHFLVDVYGPCGVFGRFSNCYIGLLTATILTAVVFLSLASSQAEIFSILNDR